MDLWWSSLKQRLTMCFSDVIVFLKAAGFGKRDDAGAADDDAGQLNKS